MSKKFEVMMHCDGENIFMIVDGVTIAKRDRKAWIPFEPGWNVRDDPFPDAITVEYQGRMFGTVSPRWLRRGTRPAALGLLCP
jgi:hypothetical protein